MLRSIHSIIGSTISATDGEIGKVKDFYFDDETLKVKYLAVETGNWLLSRQVLISPVALSNTDWNSKTFPVNLTKEQIKHSPDIDAEKPVSIQQEEELHNHYAWPFDQESGVGFMTTGMVGGVVAPGIPFDEQISEEIHKTERHTKGNRHLRSYKQVTNYTVHATDGDLGEVYDMLVDTDAWTIQFIAIETGTWYSGKKIVTSARNVNKIEWESSSVYVNQTKDSLKNSLEFDNSQGITEELERKLQNYI